MDLMARRAAMMENVVICKIITHPKDVTVDVNEYATFSVVVSGTIDYCQWQYSRNNSSWANLSRATYGSGTTINYKAARAYNGYYFRVCVFFADGTSETSNSAVLTVYLPSITQQPQDVTVSVGETAQFTVVGESEIASVRWQRSTNGGSTWSNLSTSTYGSGTTLLYTATSDSNGYMFRGYVTFVAGNNVYSDAATLTVMT